MRRVVLDTGTAVTDFPAGYLRCPRTVDGAWAQPVVSGGGQGQLPVIDMPDTRCRYLPATQTSTATQLWTVADLRVHG